MSKISNTFSNIKNHLYTAKEYVNGKWRYYYDKAKDAAKKKIFDYADNRYKINNDRYINNMKIAMPSSIDYDPNNEKSVKKSKKRRKKAYKIAEKSSKKRDAYLAIKNDLANGGSYKKALAKLAKTAISHANGKWEWSEHEYLDKLIGPNGKYRYIYEKSPMQNIAKAGYAAYQGAKKIGGAALNAGRRYGGAALNAGRRYGGAALNAAKTAGKSAINRGIAAGENYFAKQTLNDIAQKRDPSRNRAIAQGFSNVQSYLANGGSYKKVVGGAALAAAKAGGRLALKGAKAGGRLALKGAKAGGRLALKGAKKVGSAAKNKINNILKRIKAKRYSEPIGPTIPDNYDPKKKKKNNSGFITNIRKMYGM